MKTAKRNVAPQWVSGFNLGEYEVVTKELEAQDLQQALEDGLSSTILRLLNGAIHINRSSAACLDLIQDGLPSRIKGADGKFSEKLPDWKQRVRDVAKEDMAEHAKAGIEINFYTQLLKLVEAEKKAKEADPIIVAIRTKWEGSDKKAAFLARLQLPASLVTATAAEVEAAYLALDDAEDVL